MKVLTGEQMREADRRTIESGTPGELLMERAGSRVVEVMAREFPPLSRQRVLIFCGKGNNGGDGLVVARLLQERHVLVEVVRVEQNEAPQMHNPTVVVDALLGTGFHGEVEGRYAELIRSINEDFPKAKKIAVDIPSAMQVRADITVTFAAPKVELFFTENTGKLVVADIGIPDEYLETDLFASEPRDFTPLFQARKSDSNKGLYGHVLVIGGAPGKSGSVAMSGLAALRCGAGLVSVASADSSKLVPELMTEPLDDFDLEKKTVVAVGPGLGKAKKLMARLLRQVEVPMVIDADGLNSIAGTDFQGRGVETILTPHPGEMGRLVGHRVESTLDERLSIAREFSKTRNVCLVLKGHRTLISFPDGNVWINPVDSPALAKGGTGDVLTGMIAGLVAQHPNDIPTAVRAAVWLHGRCGQLAADELTDYCVLATDLFHYLPGAIRDCLHHG